MSKLALLAQLKARPGKGEEVAAFLAGAQPMAAGEAGTVAWYAVRIDAETFAIFDTFETEEGRQAHLRGPIARALMAQAEALFAVPPHISQAEILAQAGRT